MIFARPWMTHLAYLMSGALSLTLGVFVASAYIKKSLSSEVSSAYVIAQNETVTESANERATDEPAQSDFEVSAPAESDSPVPPAPNVSAGSLLPESVSLLEPYVFDTREGRRNPFRPPSASLAPAVGPTDFAIGPGTPLERYELEQVKLAAILWDINNPKAMFIDPTGEVHVLTKDDRIGRRRGYVAAIRESEVVVVEITSFSGEQQYTTRILRIDQ